MRRGQIKNINFGIKINENEKDTCSDLKKKTCKYDVLKIAIYSFFFVYRVKVKKIENLKFGHFLAPSIKIIKANNFFFISGFMNFYICSV